MGTVTNGKKWAGACVNGKVVSGLVKNGVVFYRKPVSTHRRRIMVGDNLKGKDIFSTIPQGFWQNYVTSTEIINKVDYDLVMFQNDNWNDYIRFYTNKNESLLPVVRLYDYGGIPNEIYLYQADINKETNNSKTTHKNDKDYIVSSIVENNVYRHLYIEDENIRPLKVGDVITGNTKLYFTFPDDFRNELPNQWTPSIHDIVILNENSTENTRRMSISYTSSNNNDCMIRYWYKAYDEDSWGGNTNATIFDLAKKRNLSFILAGDMNQLESVGFVGTVSTINTTSPAYKYILVDTTTLGA